MYSLEEMSEDFKKIKDAYTNAEKREIAEKYGINTLKQAEIQMEILKAIRSERQSRSPQTWTENDVLWFLRLHDYPYSSQKWKKAMEGESKEWMEFVLNTWLPKSKREDHLRNMKLLKKLIDETYAEKDSPLNTIYDKLNDITFEFRQECVSSYVDYYSNLFTEYSKLRGLTENDMMSIFGGVENRRYPVYVKRYIFNDGQSVKFMGRTIEPQEVYVREYATDGEEGYAYMPDDKCNRVMRMYREISSESNNWNFNSYSEKKRKEANDNFTAKLKVLAQKLDSYNMDARNLEIQHIDTDPKVFEAFITDGKIRLYARSILAAEYSEYMIPHYRFIVTKR